MAIQMQPGEEGGIQCIPQAVALLQLMGIQIRNKTDRHTDSRMKCGRVAKLFDGRVSALSWHADERGQTR